MVLYTALGVATVLILRTMAHRWRTEEIGEAEVPYGPSEPAPPPSPRRRWERGMSTADAVAGVLWLGVTLYAVFGGADFGAGFWALLAGGGERGARARALVDWAIGPVWEANHVWLIFVLVVLWTAFSVAFASIMSTLFIPLSLAALGIVLRGSGSPSTSSPAGSATGASRNGAFGVSSLLTPFFMGTVVGAIASGRVPVGNAAGRRRHQLAQRASRCSPARCSWPPAPTSRRCSWSATPAARATRTSSATSRLAP